MDTMQCSQCQQELPVRKEGDVRYVDCDDCCMSTNDKKAVQYRGMSPETFNDLFPARPTGYEKQWNRPF